MLKDAPLLGIIFGDAFSEKELSQGVEKMTKSPFDTLMEVSTGFVLPRTLHVIAELGIADALEETPRSAEALAAATGTNAEALNRALRVLSAHGIFRRARRGLCAYPQLTSAALGSPAVHAIVRPYAR